LIVPGAASAHRSGFVAIAGRPNAGKSTLLNRMVGSKVAIVSDKPQTTRHAIRGIVNRVGPPPGSSVFVGPWHEGQIVFVDTPGIHKPETPLGHRLNALALDAVRDADAALQVIDASRPVGRGDQFVAGRLLDSGRPVLCVLTKADLVTPPVLLAQIDAARALGPFVDVLTTSSVRGTGVEEVVQTLLGLLPEGPPFYEEDATSDQSRELAIAERIREKALELTREEVPHSVAVVVDDISRREGSDLHDVTASIYVERDSQKGIVVGKGGRMLKEIGTRARTEIEPLVGGRVFLDLRVKVQPRWQQDDQALDRFGY
jgi:GTP-binding protein Era